ncbi:hypothetical protein EGW08_007408, partial [Elysia chlorotica]
ESMELHPFLEADQRPAPRWWYVLTTVGDSPSMRVGHSATFVPGQNSGESDRVILVGGANPSQIFNEVWVLDLKTRSWDTLECPGFRGRYEHAAFMVDNCPGKLFVFGGATQEGCLNDVQSMDTATGVWTDIEVSGICPAPRTHRSAAVVGSKVYFFSGGHCGSEPVADRAVHCLDTESWSWTALTPKGNAPKPRHGHLMVSAVPNNNNARIYMHGGMSGSIFFDDLHVLDVDRCSWNLVRKKRTSPSSRAAHDGLIDQNQLLVFGGMNQEGALDDAYRFNPEGNSWTKLEFEGPAPPNRLDFAMCTIRLRVPTLSASLAAEGESELTGACANTKEILERELKPGSASSRSSFSDSDVGDEAVFPIEPADSAQAQGHQAKQRDHSGETTQPAGDDSELAATEDMRLIFIHGGMDTEGEIFDDTLVLAMPS